MIILISPSKTLDFETPVDTKDNSQARNLDESAVLIDTLKQKAPHEIASLMKLSDKLAALNDERYHSWKRPFNLNNAKQCAFAFKGDVYTGLDAESLNQKELNWAQKHLRILSGLYGTLRPLDLIQAYRLEMGTKLDNPEGKNLYEFWGNKITQNLNDDIAESKSKVVLNLASNEYFKSVKPKEISRTIISPEFKDCKKGQYKIISFYAKKARGLMAAWVIKNEITDAAKLADFDVDGYYYDKAASTPEKPIFLRDEIFK